MPAHHSQHSSISTLPLAIPMLSFLHSISIATLPFASHVVVADAGIAVDVAVVVVEVGVGLFGAIGSRFECAPHLPPVDAAVVVVVVVVVVAIVLVSVVHLDLLAPIVAPAVSLSVAFHFVHVQMQ